jgi:hypothetical protein
MVCATPRPDTLANLSKHLVDKVTTLFGTLKAWENELTVPEQERPHEKGIFMEDIGGFTNPDQEQARAHALLILQERQMPLARSLLKVDDTPHHHKAIDDAVMIELGWMLCSDPV